LNQTSRGGDCDLYVQQSTLPTRSSYYRRDISTSLSISLLLQDITLGTWYFGIYGFLACNYSMVVTTQGSCPNSCSGHGNCLNGDCFCNNGWSGSDCSKAVSPITPGNLISSVVQTTEWKYFVYNFQSTNQRDEFNLVMTQTSPGDADLYLRFQQLPTEFQYDYANVTIRDVSTLRIPSPQSGIWYIGIHGFRGCNFTLLLTTAGTCPNECSGTSHGVCIGNSCSCVSGYSGSYCQTRNTPLIANVPERGYVSVNSWNYYNYQTNSIANFVITITQTTATGDCDVYARAGQIPTRVAYDASDVQTAANFSLIIPDPGRAVWYIGIYGWSTCGYIITVTESTSCSPNCTTHGTCLADGTCMCNSGWSGDACDQRINTLVNNILKFGQLQGIAEWSYYSFKISSNSSSVHFAVKETNSVGLLWLFVTKGQNSVPSIRNYLYSSTETNTQFHRINIDLDDQPPGVETIFQLGIYANPYVIDERQILYSLIAWSPDF